MCKESKKSPADAQDKLFYIRKTSVFEKAELFFVGLEVITK